MLNRLHPTPVSAIVPLLAAALLVGCAAPEPTAEAPPPGIDPDTIEPVHVVEQLHGNDPALAEARLELIESPEGFDALGTDLALSPADVDFETQNVLVFALGEQPTGGYWVQITGAQRVDDTLWVQIVANAPDDEQAVTQELTYPYAAAVIPRVDVARVAEDIEQVRGASPEAYAPSARPADDEPADDEPTDDE